MPFFSDPGVWGPIYVSRCLSVSEKLTDNANGVFILRQCGNESDSIWWPTLESMQETSSIDQILNQFPTNHKMYIFNEIPITVLKYCKYDDEVYIQEHLVCLFVCLISVIKMI